MLLCAMQALVESKVNWRKTQIDIPAFTYLSQISSERKSFVVFAATALEKAEWINHLAEASNTRPAVSAAGVYRQRQRHSGRRLDQGKQRQRWATVGQL